MRLRRSPAPCVTTRPNDSCTWRSRWRSRPAWSSGLSWPADRLAAHRAELLREVVRDAIDRSPWHRERLADVDLARLDETSLRDVPPMTKGDLMENFDRIVGDERLSLELVNGHLETVTTGSYLHDAYTAVTSGGSTGERGVFVYDWVGWATFWVSIFRYLLRARWSRPEVESAAARPRLGGSGAFHACHGGAGPDLRQPGLRECPLPRHARHRGDRRRAQRRPAGRPARLSLGVARAELRSRRGAVADRAAADLRAVRSRCFRRSASRPRQHGASVSATRGGRPRAAASGSPASTRGRT